MKYKELDKINGITILTREHNKGHPTVCYCLCHCGNLFKTLENSLNCGQTKSCGCIRRYSSRVLNTTHNKTKHPLYHVWNSMLNRCYNTHIKNYKNYGGRGIAVCDEWKNDFQAFYDWAVCNGYDEGLQIDRIDNDGNYEPSNCRFVTRKQNCNNKRSNVRITYKGVTKTMSEWADYIGVNYKAFTHRFERNWDIERIFNQPYRVKHEQNK